MIGPIIAKSSKRIDFLEFLVMGYQAYAYRLNHNLSLVVLSPSEIVTVKLMAGEQLKVALQGNLETAIATFELLSKEIQKTQAVSAAKTTKPEASENSNACLEVKISIEDLLNALNHLSKFTSNYMGSKLTANYWQSTRPNFK